MITSYENVVRRRFIHELTQTLILRHTNTLRRIYRSKFGQAIFYTSGSLAPLVQRLRERIQVWYEVLRLPSLLRLGFTERAIADMEKIASSSPSLGERLIASWELAVHFSNRSTGVRQALDFLAFILAREKNNKRLQAAAVLKSECLERLGRGDEAITFTKLAFEEYKNDDLALALSNLYTGHTETRLSLINTVLARHKLDHISLADPSAGLGIDNIHVPSCKPGQQTDGPVVTVLMPAYNAETTIATALKSLLSQSWQNIEIIVVDDASTDNTTEVVNSLSALDNRIRLIQLKENSGPYIARNHGLSQAQGEFVTSHDTDDWSHPRKIELQASHLLNHSDVIANISRCVRVKDDMVFHRRGNPGYYVAKNMSSLMFRREQVLEKAGYWDCVRFGADSEHIRRLRKVFGENAVADLQTGPVAFAKHVESSLTGNNRFGYPGFFMGARKAYLEAYAWWHRETNDLYTDFPARERKFPIALPLNPFIKQEATASRHMDVVIATEFRLTGGTITSTLEEIKAQMAMGLQTGLIPIFRFDLDPELPWNGRILQLIDGKNTHLLAYGEEVSCDLLIVRHPPVLQEYQSYLPEIKAKNVLVIVNQAPFRDYHDPESRLYDPISCHKNILRYFHKQATWLPIGPAAREALLQDPGTQSIKVGEDDWTNIIDVEGWCAQKKPGTGTKPIIGRHSRDQYVKWPSSSEELLAAYPSNETFEVKILGGADTPRNMLDSIPGNWTVYPFNELSPRDFLAEIDVFVYFTRPGCVEAFGRAPLEAMAAGVPVILPDHFRPLFKEAAIYASPFEVQSIVLELYRDKEYHQKQSEIGRRFVREHFGYDTHRRRLAAYVQKLT